MSTQTREHGDALLTYRQALASAMSRILTGSLFLPGSSSNRQPRRGGWSLAQVVWVSVLMAFESPRPLKDRFEQARQSVVEMAPDQPPPGQTYQGYVKARGRICGKQRRAMKRHLRLCHQRMAGPCWTRQGWLALSVDGTRIEVPRTAANEQALGCAGRNKTGPQLSLTVLYHLGTGLPWTWQMGPGTESELAHLHRMKDRLAVGSLLVADAGFTGYDLLKDLVDRGVHVLVRMGSNRTLLKGLADAQVQVEGETVWFWPTAKQSTCPPLPLRLIRLEAPNRSPVYLVTSVLDSRQLTDRQVAEFYRLRWGQEVFYRSFKRTLEHYKMRSQAPQEARRELDWALIAYLTMGLLSIEGIIQTGGDPGTWSPAQAVRIVRRGLRSNGRLTGPGDLRVLLAQATKDAYVRTGSKKARNWPYKKKDPPPGIPKIREASEKEKAAARKTYERRVA